MIYTLAAWCLLLRTADLTQHKHTVGGNKSRLHAMRRGPCQQLPPRRRLCSSARWSARLRPRMRKVSWSCLLIMSSSFALTRHAHTSPALRITAERLHAQAKAPGNVSSCCYKVVFGRAMLAHSTTAPCTDSGEGMLMEASWPAPKHAKAVRQSVGA